LVVALAIISFWLLGLVTGLFVVDVGRTHPLFIAALIAAQMFLATGLFITAHDAMHRTLLPRDPFWNDVVGRVAVAFYAMFSYGMLERKHAEHHDHPARLGDPDYHGVGRPGYIAWYLNFMSNYVTLRQITLMACVFCFWWLVAGARVENIVLFWVAPALLSTLQLFTFGTYLPHREPAGGYVEPHRARSNRYPRWLSLLTCYHFGYHWEHHQYPYVPWWRLGELRASLKFDSSTEAAAWRGRS
jgi:beta-carotene ketolase (CrtW type)